MNLVRRIVRKPQVAAFDHAGTVTVLGDDYVARRFGDRDARLVRALLDSLVVPRSVDDLPEVVAALLGLDAGQVAALLPGLLAVLRDAGVVVEAEPNSAAEVASSPKRVVLGLTGAVASLFSGPLVDLLFRRGCAVRVAMTAAAARFASTEGLEALTHERVYSDLWQRDPCGPAPHVQLARWADLVLIAPASATTISRLATGDFSDLVAAVALTSRAPVVVVPSMNEAMYSAASVRRNLDQLRCDGLYVVYPALGHEVAERPEERRLAYGAAPSVDVVVRIVSFLLGQVGDTRAC